MSDVPELPHTVRLCVEWWAKKHKEYQHADRASGECGVATWNLMSFVYEKAGVSLDELFGDLVIDPDKPPRYDCHTMCAWDDVWVIDVTARQFWKDSPYPLIERLDVYAKRFDTLTRDDSEDEPVHLVQDFHERFPNLRQPDRVT